MLTRQRLAKLGDNPAYVCTKLGIVRNLSVESMAGHSAIVYPYVSTALTTSEGELEFARQLVARGERRAGCRPDGPEALSSSVSLTDDPFRQVLPAATE